MYSFGLLSLAKYKMKLILLASVILAANALSATQHWENFKVTYNKSYKTTAEDSIRYNIFLENVQKINAHNAKYLRGEETYTMAVNKFADLTEEEFIQMLKRQTKSKPTIKGALHEFPEDLKVPDAIDWRDEGAVLGVKDQGNCGSCWAFSTTGALEGQNFIVNGKSVALSEQQLVDCSQYYGNGDCDDGGDMTYAFEYIKDNGLESEASYPYEAEVVSCRAKPSKTVVNISGYKQLDATEEALLNGVGSIGPISVAINGNHLQFYWKGIFNSECKNTAQDINHAVLAVGYGEEDETPYWIVKNSWGADWGEDGYFRMKRGNNICGIYLEATYPIF